MPALLLKKMVMGSFEKGVVDSEIADSVDFMVASVSGSVLCTPIEPFDKCLISECAPLSTLCAVHAYQHYMLCTLINTTCCAPLSALHAVVQNVV